MTRILSLRRRGRLFAATVALFAAAHSLALPLTASDDAPGALFDAVAQTLANRYYDADFRSSTLHELIDAYRERAASAATHGDERAIVTEFLSNIPASHLAILSGHSYRLMMAHLTNRAVPTIGFELIELEPGRHFVHALLQGGPAHAAGVRMGDRVVSIDGVDAGASPRLDWSTDDAALPDPPIRALLVETGETVPITVERTPDEILEFDIGIIEFSSFDAARHSATVFEREGTHIGYIQLHYIHMRGPDRLLRETLDGAFRECDALILDLRGRGGNAMMVPRIIQVLTTLKARRGTQIIALIDANTRSAKEAIAWELRDRNLARLVGEATAGALLPATFAEVGEEAVLMFPSFKLPKYSDLIEGKGVDPHVHVEPLRMYTNGDDPLIDRALKEAVKMVKEAAKSEV